MGVLPSRSRMARNQAAGDAPVIRRHLLDDHEHLLGPLAEAIDERLRDVGDEPRLLLPADAFDHLDLHIGHQAPSLSEAALWSWSAAWSSSSNQCARAAMMISLPISSERP